MLASEGDRVEELLLNDEWIANRKFDGERVMALCRSSEVDIKNRRGFNKNRNFPEVLKELKALNLDADLDGEAVYFDEQGKDIREIVESRSLLTNESKIRILSDEDSFRRKPITFMVFDILRYQDHDLRSLPLMERREFLTSIPTGKYVKFVEQVVGKEDKLLLWGSIKQSNYEGLILKRFDCPYQSGVRSPYWLKLKNYKTEVKTFDGYEINPSGITLTDSVDGVRVNCAGRQSVEVKSRIDKEKSIRCEIRYLFITENGRFFQPTFKRLLK